MQILVISYDFSRHFIYQHIISNLVGMNETLLKYGKELSNCNIENPFFLEIQNTIDMNILSS